jgi:hypothetical protein
VAGKVAGDTKLESEGKADKFAGKVQNAVGGAKDALPSKQQGSGPTRSAHDLRDRQRPGYSK